MFGVMFGGESKGLSTMEKEEMVERGDCGVLIIFATEDVATALTVSTTGSTKALETDVSNFVGLFLSGFDGFDDTKLGLLERSFRSASKKYVAVKIERYNFSYSAATIK